MVCVKFQSTTALISISQHDFDVCLQENYYYNATQGVCADSLLDTGGPGNFSQEDLLQLISTGASGPDQGFLDPVFVDHEESQNAADLDQIVFEARLLSLLS